MARGIVEAGAETIAPAGSGDRRQAVRGPSPLSPKQKGTINKAAAAGIKVSSYVVPGGCWFGSIPLAESSYSFVGCTVAPGFDFNDFEIGKREDLLALYPKAEGMILELTDP